MPAVKVVSDVFPAIVVAAPSGSFGDYTLLGTGSSRPSGAMGVDRARIIVFEELVLVAVDGVAGNGPQLVFREGVRAVNLSGSRDVDSQLLTESGKGLAFRRQDNCGCGSRLRAWNPYKTLNSIKDPTL